VSNIYNNITELIGNTPIVHLQKIENEFKLKGKIFAKLEYFNPAGSVKDRIAQAMIKAAEEKGLLKAGSTIIEPTSGNTGIGLASIAAAKGYKAIFTMPETMSVERIKLLKSYGAQVVLTEGAKGMKGAIEKAIQLSETIENAFIPSQFENTVNPAVHKATTGPEIYKDMDGQLDYFVAGIGTGGTISGAGAYLKSKNSSLKVVAVEPADSPVLSQGKPGPHKIQGIGAGFIPNTLNVEIYDEIITVENQKAFETGRMIAQKEGILVGISSGAALYAAIQVAKREESDGKNIVVVFPDTGERYLSTQLFED
jgi:cysteine synthase A